jgi:replicative DNA helicase
LKLEVDTYIEDMSKVLFRKAVNVAFKEWDSSSYDQIKTSIFSGINTIDTGRGVGTLPEGNINRDMDDIIISIDTETPLSDKGVHTRFPLIDQKTGGFLPGDLIFVLAYTSQGKSTLLQNIGYNVMLGGGNCVYFVNELQYRQVKVKFLSRHTANPDFWGGQMNGVATKSIEEGLLTSNEKKVVKHAARDIRDNSDYGRVYVVQLESGSSVATIEAKLTSLQTSFNVDFVVIDDLRLCTGNLKGDDKKVLSKVVVEAKKLAVNFNGGKGVPIASPWQTKQASFEEAKKEGKYPINAASDTNEVEKQADIMIWLLQTEDLARKNQVIAGMTKNRMGPKIESFVLMENWSYSYMSELSDVVAEGGGMTVPEISKDDYDELLEDVLSIE